MDTMEVKRFVAAFIVLLVVGTIINSVLQTILAQAASTTSLTSADLLRIMLTNIVGVALVTLIPFYMAFKVYGIKKISIVKFVESFVFYIALTLIAAFALSHVFKITPMTGITSMAIMYFAISVVIDAILFYVALKIYGADK